MKKLKSLLPLALLLCAAAPTWADVDYSAGISGLHKTSGRYTSGLTLKAMNGTTEVSSKAITGLQDDSTTSTAAGSKIYWDKSSEKISLEAGQTLHVTPAGSGEWMHHYLYIDWNGDGFVYTNEDTYLETNTTPNNKPVVKDGADLVYFSVHAKDVNKNQEVTGWYKFDGTAITNGNQRNTKYTDQFDVIIPGGTPAGEYRARYKVDWRNLDPTGAVNGSYYEGNQAVDLIRSGGVIVDFTIEVTTPEPEPEIVLPEGVQVIVGKSTGSISNSVWTSNATITPGVKVTLNNLDTSHNPSIEFQTPEWLYASPHGGHHSITIESTDPKYYVKAFKFTAHTTEPRNVGTGDGTYPVDFVLSSKSHNGTCNFDNDFTLYELELTEDEAATFYIYCQNTNWKKFQLVDFVVVLAEKEDLSVTIKVSPTDGGRAWIGNNESTTEQQFDNVDAINANGVTLHAEANDGFRFSCWEHNGVNVSNNAEFTIKDISYNPVYEYTAHFVSTIIDYSAGIPTSRHKESKRYTSGLTLKAKTDEDITDSNTISGLQDDSDTASQEGSKLYWDKSAEVIKVHPGQTLRVEPAGNGEWMQQFMYIDWASDGFIYESENTYLVSGTTKPEIIEGADLVYYSVYAKDVNANQKVTGWYYFDGTAIPSDADGTKRNTKYDHEFEITIPATAPVGNYRARYKIDWRSLDPTGATGTDFYRNGGIIVDFTIRIENPNPKQAIYDAFEAEIDKYVAAGFDGNAKWADGDRTTNIDYILFALEQNIDNETSVEYFQSEVAAAREEILTNITPKGLVRIFNHDSSATNPIAMSSKDGEAVYHSGDTGEKLGTKFPNFLWNIEYRGQSKFALKNHHSQKYVGNTAHETGHVAMSPEACDLELHFTSNGHFGLYTGENGYMAYPVGDANYLVDNHSANTALWRLEYFAGAELEDGSNEGVELATKNTTTGDVTVIFQTKEGVDLTVLEEAYYEPAHMRITVSGPRTNAPMRREASLADGLKGTDLDCENGEYSFTIPAAALGNYTINVPAGFFSTNGDLTAAQSIGLNVKADSATTSISEVGVEAVEAAGIYDLQGRRLAAPVKGINIINGKKVLVK